MNDNRRSSSPREKPEPRMRIMAVPDKRARAHTHISLGCSYVLAISSIDTERAPGDEQPRPRRTHDNHRNGHPSTGTELT